MHQRGADARYVWEGVFVKTRLLFRGLQRPRPRRVEFRVQREELVENRGGNQRLKLDQVRFGFGLKLLGFLFVLIQSKRDLFLIELLEWLKPLGFS